MGQRYTIGRSKTSSLIIQAESISRIHAYLEENDDGTLTLIDNETKNGTFVSVDGEYQQVNKKKVDLTSKVKFGKVPLTIEDVLSAIQAKNENAPSKEEAIVKANNIPISQIEKVKVQQDNLDYSPKVPSENQNSNFLPSKVSAPSKKSGVLVERSIFSNLPTAVKSSLTDLDPQFHNQFAEEYRRRKKSKGLAYAAWFFLGLHYIYLKNWGTQLIYWATFAGVGIWAFVDLFRLSGVVDDYNKDVAIEVMRDIKSFSA